MHLLTDTPVVPRPRVPVDLLPVSVTVPRELMDDWPERTDCCPNCLHECGHRPITEEQRGLRILAAYRCRLCGHDWTATYRVEE